MGFKSARVPPVIYVGAFDTPPSRATLAQYRCDGVADDVEINAALASGVDVHLLAGTFNTADTIETSGVVGQVLSGQGDTTVIAPGAAVGTRAVTFAADLQRGEDFQIDGAASTAATKGIVLEGSNNALDRVLLQNVQGDSAVQIVFGFRETILRGVRIIDAALDGIADFVGHTRIEGCTVRNAGRSAVAGAGAIAGQLIAGSWFFGNAGAEAVPYIDLGQRSQMTGCFVEGSSAGPAVQVNSRCVVAANHIRLARQEGVLLAGSDAILSNNFVDRGGQDAHNTYDGIRVTGDRVSVLGNMVRRSTGANQFRYGLNIEAASDRAYIRANDLYESGATGPILLNGTFYDTGSGNRT